MAMAEKAISCLPTTSIHLFPAKRFTVVAEAKNRRKLSKVDESKLTQTSKDNTELQQTKQSEQALPSRGTVLKACLTTSGGIAAVGYILRQGSHALANLGYSSVDSSTLMSYDFQPWHLLVALGSVASVTGLRLALLKLCPDFSESSQASNKRVLSSLEPLDYVVVAVASGVSEELLFRGAFLPIVGMNFIGALVVGVVFGALHVTGGRNAAFATWACVVGVLYGVASVWTRDLSVPMLAHSSANLVAALVWKYSQDSQVPQQLNKPLT